MLCLICPEAKRRKSRQEWAGICGVCKSLCAADIEYLYRIQEESPSHAVIAPIKLRASQFASRRRYEEAWARIPLGSRVLRSAARPRLGVNSRRPAAITLLLHSGFQRGASREADESTLKVLQADATVIPFSTAAFDVVMAMDVIEHMTTAKLLDVFRNVRRVLRPGGRLIITTPSGTLTWAKRLLGRKVHETHVVEYAREDLARHLHETGFENLAFADVHFPHFPSSLLGRIAQNIVPEFPWLMSGAARVTRRLGYYNYLCVCTRTTRGTRPSA